MRIQEDVVHCTACRHEWMAQMVTDAPVEVFTASIHALRCPGCGAGARQIAFGRGDVPDPQPVQADMTDGERRAAWLKLHDNGLSSECIADVMCGIPGTGAYPHDGDDFGRCERLLILYPMWRERFAAEMPRVNAVWGALVPRWGEIAEAWRHDIELSRNPKGRAKEGRCYPLMRSIIDPAKAQMRSDQAA